MSAIFEQFNKKWAEGSIDKPLVVLIGGHIGTGKSTFASKVEQSINHSTRLPTGVVRAVCQAFIGELDHPEVFMHSYDLFTMYDSDPQKQEIISSFEKQTRDVQFPIERIIAFALSEGQHFIIEGNHITPKFIQHVWKKYPIIPFFFYVADQEEYKGLISGPTHQRTFSPEQLKTTQTIHEYFVDEARGRNLPLFEIHEQDRALSALEKHIEKVI